MYKKKKATKVTLLADENEIVVSHHISKNSNEHDLNAINPVIAKTKFNKRVIRAYGDKGYVNSRHFYKNNKRVHLIAPKKRNQKTKNTKLYIDILR